MEDISSHSSRNCDVAMHCTSEQHNWTRVSSDGRRKFVELRRYHWSFDGHLGHLTLYTKRTANYTITLPKQGRKDMAVLRLVLEIIQDAQSWEFARKVKLIKH